MADALRLFTFVFFLKMFCMSPVTFAEERTVSNFISFLCTAFRFFFGQAVVCLSYTEPAVSSRFVIAEARPISARSGSGYTTEYGVIFLDICIGVAGQLP